MPKIDANTAQNIADAFLANEVGNLLMAGEPKLTMSLRAKRSNQKGKPYWMMPILLGNARNGLLGEVGILRVDASNGRVLLSPKEKEKVKQNAKILFHRNTSSPTVS